MEKPFFALSYNNSKATSNWVSWHLTINELGNAPRFPFHPDEELPGGFTQILPKDYTGGGFDRGHMCPHSDRSADDDMSEATFVMSNIIPQSPHLNQKAWAQRAVRAKRARAQDAGCGSLLNLPTSRWFFAFFYRTC